MFLTSCYASNTLLSLAAVTGQIPLPWARHHAPDQH